MFSYETSKRRLKKICYVSSVAFDIVSAISPWAKVFGIMFSTSEKLIDDRGEYFELLNDAINNTIKKLLKDSKDSLEKDILKDLSECEEFEIDDLNELIKKTNSYNEKYGTNKDIRKIIKKFDAYFTVEISKDNILSNFYMLSAGNNIIDKLNDFSVRLEREKILLDRMTDDIYYIKATTTKSKRIVIDIFKDISFILVAMSIFLVTSVFILHYTDRSLPIVALISYGISCNYFTSTKITSQAI